MLRRSTALFVLLAAAFATVLSLGPGPASAAKPRKAARYLGLESGLVPTEDEEFVESPDAELRVSRTGRTLGRGSSITLYCGRNYTTAGTVSLRRAHDKAVRIRRGGRFSLARRHGHLRFRLRGRFVTPDYAKVVYTVRRRFKRRTCRSRRRVVGVYRGGKPPYRSCKSQGGRDLTKNDRGRVYELLTPEGFEFYTHAIACSFETNKRMDLGHDYDETLIEAVRLAGDNVGYDRFGGAEFAQGGDILVRDLRDGRVLRDIPVTGFSDQINLVLKENSSIAWTTVPISDPNSNLELWAADALGRRRLDSGSKIEPRSLTLNGSTVTWRNGGVTRSATLY